MNYAHIFRLLVRAFGVFALYQAITMLSELLVAAVASDHIMGVVFVKFIILTAAAVWFLFGAPPIEHWAYPGLKAKSKPEVKVGDLGPHCVSCSKHIPEGAKICPECGYTQPI